MELVEEAFEALNNREFWRFREITDDWVFTNWKSPDEFYQEIVRFAKERAFVGSEAVVEEKV